MDDDPSHPQPGEHPSWNPALRLHNSSDQAPRLNPQPDHDTDADFFDQITSGQPPADPAIGETQLLADAPTSETHAPSEPPAQEVHAPAPSNPTTENIGAPSEPLVEQPEPSLEQAIAPVEEAPTEHVEEAPAERVQGPKAKHEEETAIQHVQEPVTADDKVETPDDESTPAPEVSAEETVVEPTPHPETPPLIPEPTHGLHENIHQPVAGSPEDQPTTPATQVTEKPDVELSEQLAVEDAEQPAIDETRPLEEPQQTEQRPAEPFEEATIQENEHPAVEEHEQPAVDEHKQPAVEEPEQLTVEEPEQATIQEPEHPAIEEPEQQQQQPPPPEPEERTIEEPAVEEAEQSVIQEPEQAMGEHYEYQGESTAADDAVDESDSAPLLQDEGDLPTPGFASDAPAINTADVPYDALHDDPSALARAFDIAQDSSAERAAQTQTPEPVEEVQQTLEMVAEQPVEQPPQANKLMSPAQVQSQSSATFEWADYENIEDFGAVVGITTEHGDSDFGGNQISSDNHAAGSGLVASQATAMAQALQEQQSKEDAPAGEEKSEEDLAAMWAAALDDDELLDENSVDPSGFFADDDEGFLEDFDTTPAQPEDQLSPTIAPVFDAQGQMQGFTKIGGPQAQITAPASRYTPQSLSQQANPYQAPSLTALPSPYAQTPFQQQPVQQPAQRPPLSSTQSFVDRSKGGYSSPYDLPDDIVRTRRRVTPAAAPPLPQSTVPAPPPRSSSMMSVSGAAAPIAPPVLSRSVTAASFPTAPPQPSTQSAADGVAPPRSSSASGHGKDKSSGFFAELPIIPKPRSRPSGAYTPVITSPSPPVVAAPNAPPAVLQGPPPGPPSRPPSRPVMPPTAGSTPQVLAGLRQPERLPLLPDTSSAPQQLGPPQPTGPPATSRYSPAAVPASSATAPPPVAGRFSPMPPPDPAAASRYSPAPLNQALSQAQSKYTAAPVGVPATPAARPVQPFAPRTSSPLAYAEKPVGNEPVPAVRSVSYQPQAPVRQMSGVGDEVRTPPRRGSNAIEQTLSQPINFVPHPRTSAYTPMNASPESRKTQHFSPEEARTPSDRFSPPQRRPRTQSPGAVMKGPLRAITQIDRPTSAAGHATSPTVQRQDVRATLLPARRKFSTDLSFAVPQDERSADPLERYKGCPVFKWGPSGSLVSTFPKQAPFYAAGHAIPTIKCTPGSITIHDTKTTFPLDDRDAKFPGPLKGKSKKKEVLTWLSGKIEDLERTLEGALLDLDIPTLMKRRAEEKVILWKMVRVLLEHDNKIEGNPIAEDAARNILLPNLAQTGKSEEDIIGNTAPIVTAEPVSAKAVAQIKKHLLEGEREKAVWHAAEQHLWSHALLIASVAGPEIWKQVVQEFVRAQVKDAGENSQSLAALYEVFAGNWDESIDELVPPSARAGFQMISKVGSSAKNPLDGLDQWRETLGLIISNRSSNDYQAIAALGRLLSSYGRSEAAHTCYLFAKASVQLGGADDPKSDFVLLGADHKNQPQELAVDLDAILLTEIYELCASFTPVPGSTTTVHHLQAYKFQHAQILTEHGFRAEAQSYCDAITAAFKASARTSPYYHPSLLGSVDDLSRCLSQAPQVSSSGGWIPKPSMDKVSGSMWKRFNTFVAGEDDDTKSTASGGAESTDAPGPFGKVTGDTPSVSRTGSTTDLYSTMAMNGGVAAPALGSSAPSKYAPLHSGGASAARYAPSAYAPSRTSMESSRSHEPEGPTSGYAGPSSLQSPITMVPPPTQRASSTPYGAYMPQVNQPTDAHQKLGVPRPEVSRAVSDYRVHYSSQPSSRRGSGQSGVASEPRSSLDQARPAFGYQPDHSTQSAYQHSSYTPMASIYGGNAPESEEVDESKSYEAPTQSSYQPSEPSFGQEQQTSSYEPPSSSYEPLSSSYEPPASSYEPPATSYEPPTSSYEPQSSYEPPTTSYQAPTSYEPPTSSYEPPGASSGYQPYQPEPDPEEEVSAQPKKSIIDDDDDDAEFSARAAALKKAEADRAADEAFKKAAEADSERDRQAKEGGKGKGWLTGWFKKDQNLAPGPIRAKLGEQSSFYYDPDLKKWVNKKGGPTQETPSAAPPPPKGLGMRAPSAGLGAPPSGPPSRSDTPASGPPGSRPPSGPPSMTGSPMASPPQAHSASVPGLPPSGMPLTGPPSRPQTSMSNASSIDDLLGAPAPRKGGTAKGKKRGGRYVDVMAK